jgi:GTP cyclohydrolase I
MSMATSVQPNGAERPAQHLRAVRGDASIDVAAAERAVRDLLAAFGRDHNSDHLRATPRRVVGALAELLTPEPFDLTTFPNDEHYDELVVARARRAVVRA